LPRCGFIPVNAQLSELAYLPGRANNLEGAFDERQDLVTGQSLTLVRVHVYGVSFLQYPDNYAYCTIPFLEACRMLHDHQFSSREAIHQNSPVGERATWRGQEKTRDSRQPSRVSPEFRFSALAVFVFPGGPGARKLSIKSAHLQYATGFSSRQHRHASSLHVRRLRYTTFALI
jgi:hypothetical protein